MPTTSPIMWNPVTCSRPSSVVIDVLTKPQRIANSEPDRLPAENRCCPAAIRRFATTVPSKRAISDSEKPAGTHTLRIAQAVHGTFNRTTFGDDALRTVTGIRETEETSPLRRVSRCSLNCFSSAVGMHRLPWFLS